MNAIRSLVKYVNTHEKDSLVNEIEVVCSSTNDVTARIVCIKILGWIRKQNEKSVRPLKLPECPWAHCIDECIAQCKPLASVLSVVENELCFNPERPTAVVEELVALVKESYRPMLLKD